MLTEKEKEESAEYVRCVCNNLIPITAVHCPLCKKFNPCQNIDTCPMCGQSMSKE